MMNTWRMLIGRGNFPLHRRHVEMKPLVEIVKSPFANFIENRGLIAKLTVGSCAIVALGTFLDSQRGVKPHEAEPASITLPSFEYSTRPEENVLKWLNYYTTALMRTLRVAWTGLVIVNDYRTLLSQTNDVQEQNLEASGLIQSQIHLRSAKRLLDLCKLNGGVYLIWGQFISALDQPFPKEYTETMRGIQYMRHISSVQSVDRIFKEELGGNAQDLFSRFEPEPHISTPLYQIHRATLHNGTDVDVKVQHAHLDRYTFVDLAGLSTVMHVAQRVFPDFPLNRLSDELQTNTLDALDFRNEMKNRYDANSNSIEDEGQLPRVLASTRRVLVMESV